MVDSRPSSTDEKATFVAEPKSRGLFSRRKSAKANAAHDEKKRDDESEDSAPVKPAVREVPPVSFFALFRFVLLWLSTLVMQTNPLCLSGTPQNLNSSLMPSVW